MRIYPWIKNAQSQKHIFNAAVGRARHIQHSRQLSPSKQVDTNDVHS